MMMAATACTSATACLSALSPCRTSPSTSSTSSRKGIRGNGSGLRLPHVARQRVSVRGHLTALCALKEEDKKKGGGGVGQQVKDAVTDKVIDEVEAVTRKWGLEAGLFKALRNSYNTSKNKKGEDDGDEGLQAGLFRGLRNSYNNSKNKKGEDDGGDEGLQAGLFRALRNTMSKKKGDDVDEGGDGEKIGTTAKDLLARYGGAYLATSVSLSVISFGVCYALVNAGVDVAALLSLAGMQVDSGGSQLGTIALAYAAHKAASPLRFPPTVALTPVVANWLGSERKDKGGE